MSYGRGRRARFSPVGSVGASASQRSPLETRTPRHAPRASGSCLCCFLAKKKTPHLRCLCGRGRRARTLGTRFWRIVFFPYLMRLQRLWGTYRGTYNNIFEVILSYFPVHSTHLLLCGRMKLPNNRRFNYEKKNQSQVYGF